MIKILSLKDKEEWDKLADKIGSPFATWDYLLAFSYMGEAYLFCYKDKVIIPFIKRKIDGTEFYDTTSPYGYSGPLGEPELKKEALTAYYNFLSDMEIISDFMRYHPEMCNFADDNRLIFCGNTVVIDLENFDEKSPNKKCRNMINKAKNEGYTFIFEDNCYRFFDVYMETMKRNKADDFYFFPYGTISELFYSEFTKTVSVVDEENNIISTAMFLIGKDSAYYFLSGNNSIIGGANNLLVYEAAMELKKRGIKHLVLGEGLNGEDSLYKFKKSFSEKTLCYYVSKSILYHGIYEILSQGRVRGKFPQYRNRVIMGWKNLK